MSDPADFPLAETFEASIPVAWLVMLALGDLHLDIDRRIPHPGYWPVLVVILAAAGVVCLIRWAVSS